MWICCIAYATSNSNDNLHTKLYKQAAQLSQRDRTAGWVSYGQKWKTGTGLIGKHVVDFLLVVTELFSQGVTAEALGTKMDRKSAISLQHGQFDPKFKVEGDVSHQ